METRAGVSKAVLAGGELTEVASGLGDYIVVELEDDATLRLAGDGDIELDITRSARVGRKRHGRDGRGWLQGRETATYEDVGHGDESCEERGGMESAYAIADS